MFFFINSIKALYLTPDFLLITKCNNCNVLISTMRTNNERYVSLNDFKRCWKDGLFTEYKTLLVTAYSQTKILSAFFGENSVFKCINYNSKCVLFFLIKYLWQTVQALSSVMNPDSRRKENQL